MKRYGMCLSYSTSMGVDCQLVEGHKGPCFYPQTVTDTAIDKLASAQVGPTRRVYTEAEVTAAEHRGFIRGLEAARRYARKERSEFRRADCPIQATGCEWVIHAITVRIEREKGK